MASNMIRSSSPREVCADAVVGATGAERDVRIGPAPDVETLRRGEGLLIEVGRGEVQANPLPLANEPPRNLDVLGGGALQNHRRRGPP